MGVPDVLLRTFAEFPGFLSELRAEEQPVASADYSTEQLGQRASAAMRFHDVYINACIALAKQRWDRRRDNGIPVIAFCGYGRAGKDTAAEYFSLRTSALYAGSSSAVVLPLVAEIAGVPMLEAWNARHENRMFWFEACNEIRRRDRTFLVKLCLGLGDMIVGIRGGLELYESARARLIDYKVWIDGDVPLDPTVEYSANDCDFVIPNRGTQFDFYDKLDTFVRLMQTQYDTKGA